MEDRFGSCLAFTFSREPTAASRLAPTVTTFRNRSYRRILVTA